MANARRKRISSPVFGTLGYYDGNKLELTQMGAHYWDKGFTSRQEIKHEIRELANTLGHSIKVTYKGRDVYREYPFAMSRDRQRKKAVRIPASKRAQVSKRIGTLVRAGYSPNYAARLAYHQRDPKLSAAARRSLKPSQFALPERRQLPIPDASHVRNAAARLTQMHNRGTVTEKEYHSALNKILLAEKRFGIHSTIMNDPDYAVKVAEPKVGKRWVIAHKNLTKKQAQNIAKSERKTWRKVKIIERDTDPILKRCPVGTEIESLILYKDFFDKRDASGWIRRHGFQVLKTDSTKETFRFRQKSPSSFVDGSFRTISLRPGVKAIIGCPK